MASSEASTGAVKTRDGVDLKYTQSGPKDGAHLLFIAGWRQTAAQFKKQVAHFETEYRVTTYDHRSHGESGNTTHGHRIASYATDLVAVLTQLELTNVSVVAHSMGASVLWCFWDMFPQHRARIAKLVLVDQSPCMIRKPGWDDAAALRSAAVFQPGTAYDIAYDIENQGPALVKSFFTPDISAEDLEWTMQRNLQMDHETAGALLIDHASNDWRDVLPQVNVPTLVIATAASAFPAEGVQALAEVIPGAELVTFSVEDRGCHYMFWTNPDKFNKVVGDFLHK